MALILTLVLITGGAQAQLGGTGSAAADGLGVPGVGGDATTGGGSTTAISDATAGATAGIANGTVTAGANVTADVGRHVDWAFDPALRGDTWRFRAADGPRDEVHITTTWRLGDDPASWANGSTPSLHLSAGQTTLHRDAINTTAHSATFVVTHDELVRGEATGWLLTFHLHDKTAWTSGYDGNRTSLALPAPGASVTIHHTVWARDGDGDGHADDVDNCPAMANPDQANLDGDVHGDVCDEDDDGDGWSDKQEIDAGSDRRDPKSTPRDRDGDGYNNTAEAAALSNPDDASSTPEDPDADGYNNTIEAGAGSDPHNAASTPPDPDGDGLEEDNCPRVHNPGQADADSDGIGDACDTNPDDGPTGDEDGDGIQNRDDNCRTQANPGQENMDGDLRGDICDNDRDGDGHANWRDAFPDDATEWRDNDRDGVGDNADQDDDNDGLSDTAEIAGGTDPLRADTDGDRYSDLDELRMGSDALDRHDPDYRVKNVTAVGMLDGRVRISWEGSGDARIVGYTVWALEDFRVVGRTDGQSIVDDQFAGGAATYAVQARFRDSGTGYEPADTITTSLYAEDVIVWLQQAAGDAPDDGTRSEGDVEAAPAVNVPGFGIALLIGALVAIAARRQR